MRIAVSTVRARLTLWHAAALTLVVCLFAAGVFIFVRMSLYRALDQQIQEDLATIDKVYREEGLSIGSLAAKLGISQPQLANALSGRFGLSLESAARLLAWLREAA